MTTIADTKGLRADIVLADKEQVTTSSEGKPVEFELKAGRSNAIVWNFRDDINLLVTADKLDVKVQTSFDAETWFDVVAFPQVDGDGALVDYLMKHNAAVEEAASILDSATLAANTIVHVFAPYWRVRWLLTGATPDFTFSVFGYLI